MSKCISPSKLTSKGFTLVELLVVMGVIIILLSLMLPGLKELKRTSNKVLCANNLQQIGTGLVLYVEGRKNLPSSRILVEDQDPMPFGELMRVWAPEGQAFSGSRSRTRDLNVEGNLFMPGWDGLGHLYKEGYVSKLESFYCPAYVGEHTLKKDKDRWFYPERSELSLYCNYHYAGHLVWDPSQSQSLWKRRSVNTMPPDTPIVVNGMRTRFDIGHSDGYNVLNVGGSVHWKERPTILSYLPAQPNGGDSIVLREQYVNFLTSVFERD